MTKCQYADTMLLTSANLAKVDRIGMANANSNIPLNAKKKAAKTGKNAKKCTQLQFVNSIWKENAPENPAFLSIRQE